MSRLPRSLAGLLVGAALLPAAEPPGLLPGRYDRSLEHGGRTRSWIMHVPAKAPPARGWPVVLVFHGGGGSPEGMEQMSAFHRLGEAEGFVTVYPRGTGRFAKRLLTFNGGNCCGYARTHRVDDVGFVAALLDRLPTMVPVDQARIFATGMSNGAIMSYRLAAELPERIAAIAPVAAPMSPGKLEPLLPVSVIHFHGTEDLNAPLDGGTGPQSWSRTEFPPVRDGILAWVGANGCDPVPVRTVLRKTTDDPTSVVRETWSGGRQGAEVVLVTIRGGGHSWPGGPRFAAWLLGPPTREVSATAEAWAFFARHPRPGP